MTIGKPLCEIVSCNELKKPLKIVLEYIERWNKQDKDKEVAEAAQYLYEFLYKKDI